MLPKVASHLSRAAAASQSIRNALQFQSSPTAANAGSIGWAPGPSSSSWGSAGGAKQNAGSRFYNTYTHSTGRALTQANSSTSHDGNTSQNDADDERKLTKRAVAFGTRAPRSLISRSRSTSVSLISGTSPAGQKLGVLEVVQIHARSRHAFSQNHNDQALAIDASQDHHTPTSSDISHSVPEVPPSPPVSLDVARIIEASMVNNEDLTLSLTKAYLSGPGPFTTTDFNACLDSVLHFYRQDSGRPLYPVLEVYKEMMECGLQPDRNTYTMLINSLCARDAQVRNLLEHLVARQEATSQLSGQLMAEDNFDQARALFTSAAASSHTLDAATCCSLLSSCAARGDVDMAIKVYGYLEASGQAGVCEVYQHLVDVYSTAKDLDGAVEVFQEFRRLSGAGQIVWTGENSPISKQGRQVLVWNRMIRAYLVAGQPAQGLGILEQMMDSQAGLGFGLGEIPLPSPDTYSTVIAAFLDAGDIQSGLSWFNRLLAQAEPSRSHHEPVLVPHKPDELTWSTIMFALAKHGRVHDLNQLYPVMVESTHHGHIQALPLIQQLVASTNLAALESEQPYPLTDIKFITGFWTNVVVPELFESSQMDFSQAVATVRALAIRNHKEAGLAIASAILQHGATVFEGQKGEQAGSNAHLSELRKLASVLPQHLLHEVPGHLNLDLRNTLDLGLLCLNLGCEPNAGTCMSYIRAFVQSRRNGEDVQLSLRDWEVLVAAFAFAARGQGRIAPLPGFAFPGLRFLLDDMARCNVNPADLNQRFSLPLLFAMINSFGVQQGVMVTSALGEPFNRWFTSMIHKDSVPHETNTRPTYPDSASSRPVPSLVVDRQVSRLVDEHAQVRGSITPVVAFERFRASAARGLAPASDVFARLIGALGRHGEIEKVKELYTAAQAVLNCVNDRHRSGGWFQVEDSMVIAFAHARDLESANAHRQRIIGSGGQPSADAYAALILCIKDTTDDASAAMELFEESQRLQVRPNTFLYNNIISKLARARKADHALELFRRMKEAGLRPTAITYGALIGACARVGDAASAEVLFAEMTAQPNFRPRIPPYNTMMQLYVSTKPDRDRAFYYFNAMLDAGIQPSEHTYKLLLDFYGNMEPIDLKSVEEVFFRLQSDPQVQINGTHWAALITAHGCSAKDLNKALEIFESIPSHPSSSRANPALPDALVYEGLMSVLVTLQRADLLPVYLDKMMAANVRPTAYVYNLLIKGYATMDIELARRTFEELQDPPVGVAAPNNHAGSPTAGVTPEVAVYREPSTWEAMVRAELGYGDRERALSLVERMQSRNFPEAVVNRVRGIFLDEAPLEPSTVTGYLLDNSSITSSPSLHEATS